MDECIQLAFAYIEQELYWSALLIGQYLLPSSSIQSFYIVIKCLHNLKFYRKIQEIVELNPGILQYHEIRLIYIKSGFESPMESSITLEFPRQATINRLSLELFYAAFFKKENLRKKLLINSFITDKANIEPLIYLYKEGLCNHRETCFYVQQIENQELKNILVLLINNQLVPENIVCPLIIFSMSLSCQIYDHRSHAQLLTKSNGFEDLFRVCTKSLESFFECEFIYSALGMYYLYKRKFKEALKCFYKSFEINKEYGFGYLYAGVSHSFLKETESAIKILNLAYSIMNSSYLPSYYLAYEYQLMNNLGKAKYYYKNCLDTIESNEKVCLGPPTDKKVRIDVDSCREFSGVICGFIYCLIYNEEYDEAMKYIKNYNIRNLLKVFCLLFSGMFDDAKAALETCKKDTVYHAVNGYLCHLVDDFDSSIREYEKSLSLSKNQVVENLLTMAIDNLTGSKPNKAFDYSNCLFETLEYKNRVLLISD